ncbi:protein UL41A [Saimiriine betaherpesvirus 4]|uniref:Protein UL41A n=1 Tax=Saimiriine betaherpesvirus 4 TaxID=1535247 RepID=G8XSV5_9BETA|nr:protein UL41A [Saimiriine betaherpesvirus 4]AEV80901.1 protein UL41A [Saimiriine betaherpesvirus 4]
MSGNSTWTGRRFDDCRWLVGVGVFLAGLFLVACGVLTKILWKRRRDRDLVRTGSEEVVYERLSLQSDTDF